MRAKDTKDNGFVKKLIQIIWVSHDSLPSYSMKGKETKNIGFDKKIIQIL
jgi:hypothetical protein